MKKPTTKKGKMAKVSKVMTEFKKGELHSGKGGKVVKSPKQAIAIALSSSGMSKKKGK
jgi:ribosomal protein L21E